MHQGQVNIMADRASSDLLTEQGEDKQLVF